MTCKLAYIYVGDTPPPSDVSGLVASCESLDSGVWFDTGSGTLKKWASGVWSSAEGSGGASLPAGIICMWGGLVANIPSGWALCDGQNGTPDLRSRFVKGAAAGSDPGATGGAAQASYTPQGSVSQPTFFGAQGTTSAASAGAQKIGTTNSTVTLSSHTHTFTPSGTVSQPTFTGTAANIPTEPAYYALCFIQKT